MEHQTQLALALTKAERSTLSSFGGSNLHLTLCWGQILTQEGGQKEKELGTEQELSSQDDV